MRKFLELPVCPWFQIRDFILNWYFLHYIQIWFHLQNKALQQVPLVGWILIKFTGRHASMNICQLGDPRLYDSLQFQAQSGVICTRMVIIVVTQGYSLGFKLFISQAQYELRVSTGLRGLRCWTMQQKSYRWISQCCRRVSWWRHQMETLLAVCAWNSPIPGEFPAQRPVTRCFDVFFDLRLNKLLSKQSWGWWFETLSRPLWRYCNEQHWGFWGFCST